MTVSPEIAAAQAAYAARPFNVYWRTSHFSGMFRFHTAGEAIDYIFQQWASIRRMAAAERYHESFLWKSYFEGPDGAKIPAQYVVLSADVSSY